MWHYKASWCLLWRVWKLCSLFALGSLASSSAWVKRNGANRYAQRPWSQKKQKTVLRIMFWLKSRIFVSFSQVRQLPWSQKKEKKDCVAIYVLVKIQNICIISSHFCKPREKRRANEIEAKRQTQKTTIISVVKLGITLINYWYLALGSFGHKKTSLYLICHEGKWHTLK